MTHDRCLDVPNYGQVENSEISENFFRDIYIRVFDFCRRAKSKTRNNISKISEVSEFSICHFFIFQKKFFFNILKKAIPYFIFMLCIVFKAF